MEPPEEEEEEEVEEEEVAPPPTQEKEVSTLFAHLVTCYMLHVTVWS